MESKWQDALQEGEKLLWQGTTENYEALDAAHKRTIILKLIISCVIGLGLCIGYAAAAGAGNVKPLIIVIVLLICGSVPIGEMNDARNLHKVSYGLTDRRMIVLLDSPKAVEYSRVTEAVLRKDEAGHTTLLCGRDAVKSKSSKWRLFTISGPIMDEQGETCERFALYALNDVSGARKVLSEKLPCLKA